MDKEFDKAHQAANDVFSKDTASRYEMERAGSNQTKEQVQRKLIRSIPGILLMVGLLVVIYLTK